MTLVSIHACDEVFARVHAPDDAAKCWQVATEDAVLIHPAQRVRNAGRAAQDLHEQRAIFLVASESGIDLIARVPQGAHGRNSKAFELRMVLQQQKGFQNRRGLALEQTVTGLEQFGIDTKALAQFELWNALIHGINERRNQLVNNRNVRTHTIFTRLHCPEISFNVAL